MSTTNPDAVITTAPAKPRWNWWKIGFFIALFAFELTREYAVLAEAQGAMPNAFANVYGTEGYAAAQGQWTRIDGGDRLVPATVTIQCRQERGECIEVSTMVYDDYVSAPDVDLFRASFSPQAVTYENDIPECARYSVRIDLRLQQVLAARERKERPTNPACANMERRIEMRLADSNDSRPNALDGHFVPLIRIVAAIFSFIT